MLRSVTARCARRHRLRPRRVASLPGRSDGWLVRRMRSSTCRRATRPGPRAALSAVPPDIRLVALSSGDVYRALRGAAARRVDRCVALPLPEESPLRGGTSTGRSGGTRQVGQAGNHRNCDPDLDTITGSSRATQRAPGQRGGVPTSNWTRQRSRRAPIRQVFNPAPRKRSLHPSSAGQRQVGCRKITVQAGLPGRQGNAESQRST